MQSSESLQQSLKHDLITFIMDLCLFFVRWYRVTYKNGFGCSADEQWDAAGGVINSWENVDTHTNN